MPLPVKQPAFPSLSRRELLRSMGIMAGGLVAAPWLASCGESSSSSTLEVNPDQSWWLQNNFGPVLNETESFNLEVIGALPPELNGVYVRNGSNPQAGDSPHWFFGDGMLHGVRLEGGRAVWYRNRYIRTEMFERGVDYTNSGPPFAGNNQSNVSVVHHGGRLLSSGEVGAAYAIDPDNLGTIGVHDFDGKLNTSFTAHPKIDPETANMHFFGYFFANPFLTYHVANPAGEIIHSSPVALPHSSMMHSFAITEQDVVFWDLPVHFAPGASTTPGFPYAWQEGAPARIGVMPLGGRGDEIRWVEIDPCYVFHEVNAHRAGSEIVLDVCRMDRVMDGQPLHAARQDLRRWHIETGGTNLGFREEVIRPRALEFPMHDKRFTGRSHRHAWLTGFRENPDTLDPFGIVHLDVTRGSILGEWDPGQGRHAGEAYFVPGGRGEGEGWLMTYIHDHSRGSSRLVVLDATRVSRGPVAEVTLPQRVPHGFHGTWVPDPA